MKLRIYQIDAFADKLFQGNPAGVCPLEEWIPDELMQKIAMENNLSETAFFVRDGGRYRLRWFTPAVEVDLCGHATLASAHVLFNHEGVEDEAVEFDTRSGILTVRREGDLLIMNFPADRPEPVEIPVAAEAAFGSPREAYKGKSDYLLVYSSRKEIEEMKPDLSYLADVPIRGFIVTAPGGDVDFVSRFFAPAVGVNEDPVTGSAHTLLTPFWAERLGKSRLTALQLSKRTGRLECALSGDRVEIAGRARTYLEGWIEI